jgi:hypothetical protein
LLIVPLFDRHLRFICLSAEFGKNRTAGYFHCSLSFSHAATQHELQYIRCITRCLHQPTSPFPDPFVALIPQCAVTVQAWSEALILSLCLSLPLCLALPYTSLDLCNNMHLLLSHSDSLGPSPRWDLALVQLVDFGGGTANACQTCAVKGKGTELTFWSRGGRTT